jgi:acetyltransferase-like isoleucine patch superfamily enzyme
MLTGHRRSRIGFEGSPRFIPRVLTKLYNTWLGVAYSFAHLGKKVSIHYTCDLHNTTLMDIGDFVTVHRDVWLHAHRTAENNEGKVLTIGDRCFIARRSHISAKNSIVIESDVLLAASVLIQDHGHQFSNIEVPIKNQGTAEGGTIRIGQGCWIGQSAAIICDSGELTLGRNCVVGANAVVTRSAPPYSVLLGNPARIVKQFDTVKGVWVLGASRQGEKGSVNSPETARET